MKKAHPTELATTLLNRSICAVQVGAVIADQEGVFSWGWNSMGLDGLGEHAEAHAIRRGNSKRMPHAVIYVAAQRKRNKRIVTARPCDECQHLITKYYMAVMFRDADGLWRPV